jgi:transcriptional regulator with XRE-family HTH domain
MTDALTSRHMGAVIKAYRRHHFHGRHPIPQETVAGWLGVTQGQLSRIENGPAVVHLDRLIQWARLLGMPSSCLWFTLPEDDQRTSPGGHRDELAARQMPGTDDGSDVSLWWAPADTVEVVSQFTRRDLTLDRREVTRLLAGVVFGSALLEPLERWLSGGAEKPRAGRPGAVGYQEVEQIEKAARIFRDWDDQFGGGLRRKAVVGQLNEVADLLTDTHPIATATSVRRNGTAVGNCRNDVVGFRAPGPHPTLLYVSTQSIQSCWRPRVCCQRHGSDGTATAIP